MTRRQFSSRIADARRRFARVVRPPPSTTLAFFCRVPGQGAAFDHAGKHAGADLLGKSHPSRTRHLARRNPARLNPPKTRRLAPCQKRLHPNPAIPERNSRNV
jgi:hypothetical protein